MPNPWLQLQLLKTSPILQEREFCHPSEELDGTHHTRDLCLKEVAPSVVIISAHIH